MKTMVCEICRGHDFLKRDGEYVCVTCNTRYTTEEARKLLVDAYNGNRVDKRIRDYLDLAVRARDSGAYFESEVYCDKALGLDADNYQALRLKAEVVALQTTDSDDRTVEAISYYERALAVAPEESREGLRVAAAQTVYKAIRARALLLGNRFATMADEGAASALLALPLYVADRDARLREAVGATALDGGMRANVANTMDASATLAWNRVVLPAYANDAHRGRTAMDAFVDGGDRVIAVLEGAYRLDQDDADSSKRRLLGLIAVQEAVIDAHSMRQHGGRWVRAYSLSEEDKARRRDDVLAWRRLVREIDPSYEFAVGAKPSVDQAAGGKRDRPKGVMSRTVTWQLLVAMLCFARFLSPGASSQGVLPESLLWLGMGVAFAYWWYQVSG